MIRSEGVIMLVEGTRGDGVRTTPPCHEVTPCQKHGGGVGREMTPDHPASSPARSLKRATIVNLVFSQK